MQTERKGTDNSSREAVARAAQGQNTSHMTQTLITGSRAGEHNSPRSGDGICINHDVRMKVTNPQG